MNDKFHQISETELIEQLSSLPLQEAPPDLTARVMNSVSPPRTPLLRSVWSYLVNPQPLPFRPIYAFSVLVLAGFAFWAGTSIQPVTQPTAQLETNTSSLQTAMIESPRSAFLVGRSLLQSGNNHEQALNFLMQASMSEPDNPEFAYWEGVGYWANGNQAQEQKSYLRGLETDPDNIPLLINLGHSYLSQKKYHQALETYQSVLVIRPDESSALYNSGLIYRALGMQPEEISSWLSYLQFNRYGSKPFRALRRLNDYGDFTFRSYQIGAQRFIVNQRALLSDMAGVEIQRTELVDIAEALEQDTSLKLETVVFIENDREAARKLALRIRNMMSGISRTDIEDRVGLSWFDAPERIQRFENDQLHILSEGLLLFTHQVEQRERETSI